MLLVSANLCWQMPCPIPGDLPNPGIEPASLTSPALAGGFFTSSTTWEAPIIWHLKQIGKVKMLTQWVLHELTRNLKNHQFWSVVFSYSVRQRTISQIVTGDKKVDFIWQLATTSSVAGLRRSSKALPKAKLATTKKVMVTVWWSAASLIHYSFLNPSEIITSEKFAQQINQMHRKLQCLQLALVNRMVPVLHDNTQPHIVQPTLQKLNKLGYEILLHLPYSPDLSPTDYCFKHLNSFLQGNNFHNQQEAENAFEEFVESQSTNFYATGINKLILIGKKCVDCNGSYFD